MDIAPLPLAAAAKGAAEGAAAAVGDNSAPSFPTLAAGWWRGACAIGLRCAAALPAGEAGASFQSCSTALPEAERLKRVNESLCSIIKISFCAVSNR